MWPPQSGNTAARQAGADADWWRDVTNRLASEEYHVASTKGGHVQDLARGVDAQLDPAIEEVLRMREQHPPQKPQFAPTPDRSREAYASEK